MDSVHILAACKCTSVHRCMHLGRGQVESFAFAIFFSFLFMENRLLNEENLPAFFFFCSGCGLAAPASSSEDDDSEEAGSLIVGVFFGSFPRRNGMAKEKIDDFLR